MNLYIIFTVDIHPIGGNQLFTNEIAKYFENKKDWEVCVVHNGRALGNCKIAELNKYLDGGNPLFYQYKPCQIQASILENIYANTVSNLGITIEKYNKILIGAQNNNMAVWAEYFAHKMNAQMICFDVSEVFRGKGFCYEEYMDFFKYKFYRKELYSLNISKLFEGYIDIQNPSEYKLLATEGKPIQEVDNATIRDICRLDYNIAYIGRVQKKYFPAVVNGVAEFAKKYRRKMVQFVVVGEADSKLQLIAERLLSIPNVKVLLLGDMVPIPKILFDKVDVVLAGSGAADYSARENVPVIVPDAYNCKANGVLGYTCGIDEFLYHKSDNNQKTILETLEDVLIHKQYLNFKRELPPIEDYSARIDDMIEKFKFAARDRHYYPVEEKDDIKQVTKEEIPQFTEDINNIRAKIAKWKNSKKTIVFGTGNEGNRCYYWLKNINVKIDAYIDNNNVRWYMELNGVDIYPVFYLDTISNATIIISSDIYGNEMLKQLEELQYDKNNNIILFSDLKKYDRVVLLDK